MPALKGCQLRRVATVHEKPPDRVPGRERRQLRGVPQLQPGVLRDVPGTHPGLVALRCSHRLLVVGGMPVGQRRMLGVVPVVEPLMVGKVISGNPRMVVNMPPLEVRVLGQMTLPDRAGDAVLLSHPDPFHGLEASPRYSRASNRESCSTTLHRRANVHIPEHQRLDADVSDSPIRGNPEFPTKCCSVNGYLEKVPKPRGPEVTAFALGNR